MALTARRLNGADLDALQQLAESSQAVVYRRQLWPADRFEYVSSGLTKLVGYSPDEACRGPVPDILARESDRTRSVPDLLSGAPEPIELPLRHRDGGIVWIEKTQAPIFDGEGRLIAVQGLIRDITRRRRMEVAQRFLAELGATLLGTLDLESMLQQAAELALVHLADICVIELVEGASVRHRVVAHRDAAIVEFMRRSTTTRDARHLAWRVYDGQAPLLITSMTSAEMPDLPPSMARALTPSSYLGVPLRVRGRVLGVLHLGSMRSDRRYDAEDVAFGEEIAGRIAMAIDNAMLHATVRRGNEVRDQVLSAVAHDLRNPLAAIRLSAESLERGTSGRSARLATISKSVDRADGLLRDLLDVSRLDGGGLELERVAISPALVLADAVDAMAPLAVAASVELRHSADADLSPIEVDTRRMSQVFSNLVGNAIKFIGPGGGLVELRAWPDNNRVRFEVRDSGPGIADHDLPRLFERYWQAQHNDRRGAGLGLAITKGIVEAHGGEIWVASQLGRGTTFHIALPARAAKEARDQIDRGHRQAS